MIPIYVPTYPVPVQTSAVDLTGVADEDAIIQSLATSLTPVTLEGEDLDGLIGDGAIDPPQTLCLVLSNTVGAFNASDPFVVNGLDKDGNAISEEFQPPTADGNTTLRGNKFFASVTSVDEPAQPDDDGTFELGVNADVNLEDPGAWGTPPEGVEVPPFARRLWIGTGGTVVARKVFDTEYHTFLNVPDGAFLDGAYVAVRPDGTTADDIVAER